MATQRKVGTSLNDERQRKLAEIVDAEPLACPSAVLAVSLDVMHSLWLGSGRDLKAALRAIPATAAKFAPGVTGAPKTRRCA